MKNVPMKNEDYPCKGLTVEGLDLAITYMNEKLYSDEQSKAHFQQDEKLNLFTTSLQNA